MQWLVFVDDLHLRFRDTGRTRAAVRGLLDEASARGDAVAVHSDGPSSLEVAATDDRPRQLDAVKRLTGNALHDDDALRSWHEPRPRHGREVVYRATAALTALRAWVELPRDRHAAGILVVVSEGLPVAAASPGAAPTLGPALLAMGAERTDVRDLAAAVIASARAARLPVLAFDPREPSALAPVGTRLDAATLAELRTLQRTSLEELAAATGGAFAQGPSALPAAMAQVRALVAP